MKLTVADLRAARDAEEYTEMVHAWADSVWQAYAAEHELARVWIEEALNV
jgi:hypothetical protein